ncbi:MAG: efflux RND transporter periplasmic adaptor subunit [Desulfovibrionaceae bacterium]
MSKRIFICCVYLFSFSILVACGNDKVAENRQLPPPPVVIEEVRLKTQPVVYRYPAQITGVNSISVYARVQGTLLKQLYKNGAFVKKGTSLFLIDPSEYEAVYKERKAQYDGAVAQYNYAKADFGRIENLYKKQAYSQDQYEQALSTYKLSVSSMNAAKQAMDNAAISLGYTNVLATSDGIVQKPELTIGSLVRANDLLTSIADTTSLYVEFAIPSTRRQNIENLFTKGIFVLSSEGYSIEVILEDGTSFPQRASVDFQGTEINTYTNSIQWRGIVNSARDALLPGSFVDIKLHGLMAKGAIIIPQKSILSQGTQSMVWVVGEGNIAQIRPIVLGEAIGTDILVLQGLNEGERIITEGILKARPGAPVAPRPTSIPVDIETGHPGMSSTQKEDNPRAQSMYILPGSNEA